MFLTTDYIYTLTEWSHKPHDACSLEIRVIEVIKMQFLYQLLLKALGEPDTMTTGASQIGRILKWLKTFALRILKHACWKYPQRRIIRSLEEKQDHRESSKPRIIARIRSDGSVFLNQDVEVWFAGKLLLWRQPQGFKHLSLERASTALQTQTHSFLIRKLKKNVIQVKFFKQQKEWR